MRPLLTAAGTFGALVAIFFLVTGPVRGSVGDVLVILFLVASLASVRVGTAMTRIGGVFLLAVGIELFQLLELVGPDAPAIAHAVLGSTFDPLDLLWYAVGAGVSWFAEAWFAR
ncbi:MAG: DUF2809 domain-containing protein [Proteobacteria bacterium]|nr:DUF2809 domain-containing protein [Pseudomonadota bacterium]MCP4918131.1 DUF2809 domain-containing protein [Pseudomonadota bacterium]